MAASAGTDLHDALLPFALCNDGRLTPEGIIGDPTEAALVVLAVKAGIDVDLRAHMTRTVARQPVRKPRRSHA
ncbi:hypothetical protein [Streptomyces sp. ADI98-10]|uniref:hypothetical protein n=1 Tax=Streptomyces sp. ADI98-10 TaxID=1522763 RepID=UPI000F54F746|nr:hypothetical protein [Streptomyces sp. ADI98-10]RPK80706.1 hypothetical protein EES46_30370 [Streptomyces sp. ADI98-10]